MKNVVKDWISHLTFKQQTVLLSAIRGCGGVPKDDPSKPFVRAFREVVLENAVTEDCSFMGASISIDDVNRFVKSLDCYPMHWLLHFIHAVECVGYGHPDLCTSVWWAGLYGEICRALHVNPESEQGWSQRLVDGPSSDCWKA